MQRISRTGEQVRHEEMKQEDSGRISLPGITQDQEEAIRRKIEAEQRKPLVVVVMGQTGIGKSSLINALFGTQLEVDDVRPCTSVPHRHVEKSTDGHELWFWDMPGIGESPSVDVGYIDEYRQKIVEADIALWLCHADSRSVTFEVETLRTIFAQVPDDEQTTLISKVTFALTKADLITPEPWLAQKSNSQVVFAPHPTTRTLLDAKAEYFRKALIEPFGNKFVSRTFHDGTFALHREGLSYDKYFAYYTGFMTPSTLDYLQSLRPRYSDIYERLYQNSEVTYCSSRFRYNLAKLMRVIVDKLGGEASMRFSHFTSPEAMYPVPWDTARKFSNMTVIDADKDEIISDLAGITQQ